MSRRARAVSLLALVSLSAVACPPSEPVGPPAPSGVPAPPVFAPEATPKGRLPAGVTPLSYSLELSIDPAQTFFSGAARVRIKTDAPRRSLFLHGRDLSLRGVLVDTASGGKISAVATALPDQELVRIDLAPELPAGEHTLTVQYDAPFADSLSGLYRVQTDSGPYVFTQFEPVDARRAFPCFDEPSFKTPVRGHPRRAQGERRHLQRSSGEDHVRGGLHARGVRGDAPAADVPDRLRRRSVRRGRGRAHCRERDSKGPGAPARGSP
jgi:hypothetical protein